MTIEWTKLIALVLVDAGAIVGLVTGRMAEASAVGLLGGSLGYVFGNGHGLMQSRAAVSRTASLPPTPHG